MGEQSEHPACNIYYIIIIILSSHSGSVNDRLSACINYRHPRLRQILREITDPFTVLEQKLALSLEGK